MRNLLLPAGPRDKTLAKLKNTLRVHLKSKPLMIAERLKFYRITQREGESVAEFIVALKELLMHCDFGTFLNEALRDLLICGLAREATQKRLLTEAELTFKKACEIVQAMEMADKNASKLKSEETKLGINVLKKSPEESKGNPNRRHQTSERNCYRCGRSHSPTSCRFKTEKCRKCGKIGHIKRKCHTKNAFRG